ncbi:MAG: DUF502 domain-containing protein [Planctomycetota bacterium]|jgi:uncharacterized membrane protein
MKRHIRIFLAGVMVVAPLAVTAYVMWWAGAGLDGLARSAVEAVSPKAAEKLIPGIGALVLVVAVYVVGLLTKVWGFRWIMGAMEGLVVRLPVVRSLYESVRDILKLFSGDPAQMGQVVRYRLPGSEVEVLGIQTSASPRAAGRAGLVSVYLPLSYMVGGPTLYVPADAVTPVDMPVEEALRIAATADAGGAPAERGRTDKPAREPAEGKG